MDTGRSVSPTPRPLHETHVVPRLNLPEHHGSFVIHHGRIEILGDCRVEGLGTNQLRFSPRTEG